MKRVGRAFLFTSFTYLIENNHDFIIIELWKENLMAMKFSSVIFILTFSIVMLTYVMLFNIHVNIILYGEID